jgi:hypothetical protein
MRATSGKWLHFTVAGFLEIIYYPKIPGCVMWADVFRGVSS